MTPKHLESTNFSGTSGLSQRLCAKTIQNSNDWPIHSWHLEHVFDNPMAPSEPVFVMFGQKRSGFDQKEERKKKKHVFWYQIAIPGVFFFDIHQIHQWTAALRTGSSVTATTSCWASFVPRSSRSSCLRQICLPPRCLIELRPKGGNSAKGTLDLCGKTRCTLWLCQNSFYRN